MQSSRCSTFMNFLQSSRKDVAAMAVFSPVGTLLASTSGDLSKSAREVRSFGWFQRPINANTSTVFFSPPYVQNIFAGQYAWRRYMAATRQEVAGRYSHWLPVRSAARRRVSVWRNPAQTHNRQAARYRYTQGRYSLGMRAQLPEKRATRGSARLTGNGHPP